jgi:hypothetical protein
MKTNKVIFVPISAQPEIFDNLVPPVASSKTVPNWYKDLCSFGGDSKNLKDLKPSNDRSSDGSNVSTKLCMPFLDAMTCGYMYVLEDDLNIQLDNDGIPEIFWEKNLMIMDKRINVDIAIPQDCHPIPFGIKMHWYYQTPPGYSLLFTHPLNRPDLPFYVSSGIIDCDIWGLPVFLPFFLKKGFEGIIKQGTPLIQMIPIKREPWELVIDKDEKTIDKHVVREEKRRSHITAHYKKTTWQKKYY